MFWSKINLVFQILLVIAAVVVFSFFDPLGWLAPRKLTLQDTPVSVVSIREIGQLITAEYYGEVITSLQESEKNEIETKGEDFTKSLTQLESSYYDAIKFFFEKKDSIKKKIRWLTKRKDLTETFYNANLGLVGNPFYQKFVEMLIDIGKKRNETKDWFKHIDDERDLLLKVYKGNTAPDFTNVFKDMPTWQKQINDAIKKEESDLMADKKFRKKQIIIIGRGSVKAGIDFGNFNENNFKYDKSKKIVYLFGIEPKILTCDINPWFIPEKKIKGFEIIAATNRAKSPDYLNEVKKTCLDQLRAQAEAAGIIKRAKTYAEESLRNFFSLLLDEPIEKVVMLEMPLRDFELPIMNHLLPVDRLQLIDHRLLSLDSIDSLAASQFVTKLRQSKFIYGKDTLAITRYTSLLAAMAADSVINIVEWNSITQIFLSHSKLDTLWFFPYDTYERIGRESKLEGANLTSYVGKGATLWFDSVTNNKAYLTFIGKSDSLKYKHIQERMDTNRSEAIEQSKSFLKKNIREVRINPRRTFKRMSVDSLIDSYHFQGR